MWASLIVDTQAAYYRLARYSGGDRWEWEQLTHHQQIRCYVNRNRVAHRLALDDDNEKCGDADRHLRVLCGPGAGLNGPATLADLHEKLKTAA